MFMGSAPFESARFSLRWSDVAVSPPYRFEKRVGHHTVYIGVHVPKSYRRRRRHRRRPKEKKEKEKITEYYSDKSDVENADETSSSILKPLR
ncbi:UNVERIFIED_CONTAM: Electrogenic sodium bicarbonate cotransporter 1 [Gekko kuhli]